MAMPLLERGMTQAEFEEYLRGNEDVKDLVGNLGSGEECVHVMEATLVR